jgi:phospholipase/carboxylesterase
MPTSGNQAVHKKGIVTQGPKPAEAGKALILLHGRGAGARDILTLADYLAVEHYALIAPEATNNTWYPYSFLALPEQNEPWLTSALDVLTEVVGDLHAAGLKSEDIYFAGFSQGACLTLEFIARNARKWGGAVAFTGGLIGDRIYRYRYNGRFASTPMYIGTSDPDPHVPVSRVNETAKVLREMGADVTLEIFPGLGHTISNKEIERANALIFRT